MWLIEQKGWKSEDLPFEKTIGNILNRLGFRLRRVQKARPVRKVRQTDATFDNGPSNSSFRTQFMKRMVEFADRNDLEIALVYYPPYHSKYNPVERCWGILEAHWNGTLSNHRTTVLEWARTMTWNGIRPVVELLDRVYETGVKITKKLFRPIEQRLNRKDTIPKYSVRIEPRPT